MQKFQTAITSPTGDVIPNAVVTVKTLAGAAADLYVDNGVTPYPTNQLTTDSQGEFSFYAANGRYSYTVAATSYTTESYTDFLLYDPDDSGVGLSVIGFGAYGDGVTDDTTAFQAAVDYAASQNGGTILVPPGTFLISSTIVINTANIILQGEGSAWNHSSSPQISEAASVLKWSGAAGGTMIRFVSDGGTSGQKQSGGGVEDICFDSGATISGTGASYGVRISSWNRAFFTGLYFYEFQVAAMLFDCVPYLNDARDPQMNRTIDCASRNSVNGNGGLLKLYGDRTAGAAWTIATSYLAEDLVTDSSLSYKALRNNVGATPGTSPNDWVQVTGASATGANVSLNHFEQLGGYFTNGNFIDIYNTDHNFFFNTRAQRLSSGTGYVVAFQGSNFTTNTSAPFNGKGARYNTFIGFSGGYSGRAYGSPTYLYPSFANNILVGDSGNNFPSPLKGLMTVDTGASVYVTDDQSQSYRTLNVQSFSYPYASQAAFDPVNGVQTGYPYSDSTAAGAYFFNNPAGTLDNIVLGKPVASGNGVYYSQYELALRAAPSGRFGFFQGFTATGAATVQWNPGATYAINDLALYGGLSYVAIAATTTWSAGTNYAINNLVAYIGVAYVAIAATTTWSVGTAYVTNNLVTYSGLTYIAIASTTGDIPSSSPAKWSLATPSSATAGWSLATPSTATASWSTVTTWSAATSYLIGALAVYQGITYQAIPTPSGVSPSSYANLNNIPSSTPLYWRAVTAKIERIRLDENGNFYQISPQLIGYGAGSGGSVIQPTGGATPRTNPVTINTPAGTITMVTAAGSATAATFVVNNNLVVATDTIILSVRAATNTYLTSVSNVGAGTFSVTFYTTGGTASDTPLINFSIIHAVTA